MRDDASVRPSEDSALRHVQELLQGEYAGGTRQLVNGSASIDKQDVNGVVVCSFGLEMDLDEKK